MIGQPITLWRWLLRFPWYLLLLSMALVTVGSLALYSASEGSWSPWAGRHAVRGAVGVCIVLLVGSRRSTPAAVNGPMLYNGTAIGMLAILMIVDSERFVSRWITIGGFSFQPRNQRRLP